MKRAHRRWLTVGAGILAVLALLFVCAVIVPAPAGGGGPSRPAQLEVNLVSEPLTVAADDGIWFSWVSADARRGQRQRGYQLRVAASAAGLSPSRTALWDSGEVTSGAPDASYGGPALAGGTRYWWAVRTFDAQGRASQWSPAAQFGTALPATWDARPIWARAPAGHPSSGWAFLRGQLAVGRQPIRAATVYATGGPAETTRQYVYRLSLNGTVLGVGPPRPADPVTQTVYQAWDVTRDLRAGVNVFGALAYTTARPGFQLELVVQYQDGKRQVWGSGPAWKGLDGGSAYPAAGSVSPAYYTAPVENLDARRYPAGFDTTAYKPAVASGWTGAVTRPDLAGLTPDTAANMTLTAHQPVKITALGPGHYLLDFGVTQVGGLRLTLDGTAGEKVRIRSGEILSSPDSVRYRLSTGDTYDDTWTLRSGRQTLQYWGYRVFRYAEVTGVPQPLTAANTAALALTYPSQPAQSSLTSSSTALDQVWQFSKDTIGALNLDLYLDSPTRERSGEYLGDDYVHQRAQAVTDGDSALAQYSLQYALTGMSLAAGGTAPIFEFEQLAPVAALAQWQQTGDPAVLRSLYGQLQRLLPSRYLGRDGLVTMTPNPFGGAHPVAGEPGQLVDWPAADRDGFVFSRQNTVVNAFAYAAYNAMAQIAAVVGDPSAARADAATAARIATAVRERLYDPVTGAFRDGAGVTHEAVQSSVYAVALGAAGPHQAKTAAAWIATKGMACSAYCAGYLLEALYAGGQAQAALNLLTAGTGTSWRHMISLGAGSTMEAWSPALKPNLTYSHPWSASPAYVVPEDLFGLRPLTPGWGTVLVRPQPASLTSGSVQVPTPRGPVSAAFSGAGPRFTLEVTIPVTATAVVVLPGVRLGQRVWVDGAVRTARPLPGDGPAGGAAGWPVVTVTSGFHRITLAVP